MQTLTIDQITEYLHNFNEKCSITGHFKICKDCLKT